MEGCLGLQRAGQGEGPQVGCRRVRVERVARHPWRVGIPQGHYYVGTNPHAGERRNEVRASNPARADAALTGLGNAEHVTQIIR